MNQYLKVGSGAFFYILLALGVWQHWWLPDTLLTAIYGGMGALGLLGSVHYGAKYLQYQSPDAGKMVPIVNPTQELPK